MNDYSRLGLNQYLVNVNSPLARPLNAQDSLSFDNNLYDTGIDQLKANTVGTAQLKSGAVTGTNIAQGVVAGTHLGGSIVNGTHIADGAINGSNIAGSTIVGTHYATLDLEKGTGAFINVTNVGTMGTVYASNEFSANGTAGFSGDIDIATTATITVTYGLITGTA